MSKDKNDRLQQKGLFRLHQIANGDATNIRQHGWHLANFLGLEDEQSNEWNAYLDYLKKGHISLKDEPDSLGLARNKVGGEYTAKLGYKAMFK